MEHLRYAWDGFRTDSNSTIMPEQLFSIIMCDGSRHFGDLPQTVSWYDLRDHIAQLDGAVVTGFITDHVTEAWIDFTYCDHQFSVNDQYGDYWFFVDRPDCPDAILQHVLGYCRRLIDAQ